jgi:putative DNA primase/helicase
MTHLAGVAYDPEAACPLWTGHLDRILGRDVQLILFLQRWAGRALSGVAPSDNKRILMPYGTGANGKTVTVETLAAILGDYAATTDFTTWCVGAESAGAAQRQDLVELAGKRLVTATESGYHHKLDEALLKQYTGGEHVSPRGMYARQSTVFRPCFSLLLSTNHLPRLEGADQGFWRRFLKMGFEVSIPEPDQDAGLMHKLADELPGIFNWMVDGYQRWKEAGLDPPTSVLVETAAYRNEIDVIGQFIEQELEPAAGSETLLADVFSRYVLWCSSSGIKRPMTLQQLSSRLAEHGVKRGQNQPHRRAVVRDLVLRQRDLGSEGWDRYRTSRPSDHPSGPSDEFPF